MEKRVGFATKILQKPDARTSISVHDMKLKLFLTYTIKKELAERYNP